jgi:hypothetical protein
MKIAIVGGGWVGCHLAYKLKDLHDIVLFEKNEKLFTETSYNNQNRLHLGYHYARNFKTRKLCLDTYEKFLFDYGHLTEKVSNNYYCIPHESILDFATFQQIFHKFGNKEVESPFENIEGCVYTEERYINFHKAHEFFNDVLRDIFVNRNINSIDDIANQYDLVINATNNFLDHNENSFFELTLTLLYNKNNQIKFDAMTLVDGEFFSLYPYKENKYTLTDVEHTPIARFNSVKELNAYSISTDLIQSKKKLIEEKVISYYPNFLFDFIYDGYFLATKSKVHSQSADRYPVITKAGNVVSCFTGKIQGIYVIEEYIQDLLK